MGSQPVDAGAPPAAYALDLEPFRARAQVPGLAVVAASASRVVVEGAVGWADVERRVAARVDAPFHAASLAKLVVAACAALLVEAGHVEEAADAAGLLGFPLRSARAPDRVVTFRALLEHTSGLRDRWSMLATERRAPDGGEQHLASFARAYVQDARDGSAWSDDEPGAFRYANIGTALAALAMQRREGAPFEEVASRLVLGPAGMTSTSFAPRADGAPSYVASAGSFRRVETRDRVVAPSAGLFASARDLGRFARLLLGRGVLDGARVWPEPAVRRLLAPSFGVQHIALGDAGASAIGHEGEDAGASAALVLDPVRGVAAVVLANGDAFASGDASRSRAIVDLLDALLARASVAPASK